MKKKELQGQSKEELQKTLATNVEKLQRMRFDIAYNKVKNMKEVGLIKKTIARAKTLLRG